MDLVCPRCRHALVEASKEWTCGGCGSSWPIVAGIPDLRVAADPHIGVEEDREKAGRLAREADGRTLEELVSFYFSITPEVPPDRVRPFTSAKIHLGPARAEDRLEAWTRRVTLPGTRVLDLGCGAGAWLPSLTQHFTSVIGVDVALRWLVVARKALEEVGAQATLVCANAEHLPFADNVVDAVVGANVLEHVADAPRSLGEAVRVLDRDGVCLLTTPNRLSLLPEPHVGIPALGWLPRRVADELVRRVRGVPYGGVTLRTAPGLVDLASAAGFRRVRVHPPSIGPRERETLGRMGSLAAGAYELIRRAPGGRMGLQAVGPLLEVDAFKGPNKKVIPVGRGRD